jgi:hypothetical protein
MKKLQIVLLAIFYTFSNLSMSVSMHFCSDTLSSVSFLGAAEPCACGGSSSEKSDCCKDTIQDLQTDEGLKTNYTIQWLSEYHPVVTFRPLFGVCVFSNPSNTFHSIPNDYIPDKVPIWLSYRNLRV